MSGTRLDPNMLRGCAPLVLIMLVVAGALLPIAGANHCQTKINVYGRIQLAPLAPPPYSSTTHSVCLRVLNDGVIDDHSLPINTDQVYVRVNGDFGPSIQKLRMTLNGLGFVSNDFYINRTANQFGGFTYNIADWLPLPNGPVDGTLTATVYYPGNVPYSVVYHTTATVLPPPLPTIPPNP